MEVGKDGLVRSNMNVPQVIVVVCGETQDAALFFYFYFHLPAV